MRRQDPRRAPFSRGHPGVASRTDITTCGDSAPRASTAQPRHCRAHCPPPPTHPRPRTPTCAAVRADLNPAHVPDRQSRGQHMSDKGTAAKGIKLPRPPAQRDPDPPCHRRRGRSQIHLAIFVKIRFKDLLFGRRRWP